MPPKLQQGVTQFRAKFGSELLPDAGLLGFLANDPDEDDDTQRDALGNTEWTYFFSSGSGTRLRSSSSRCCSVGPGGGAGRGELVAAEPELERLLKIARMVGDGCRNWRDVERGWGQFKNDVAGLVGYLGKHRGHPLLGTNAAYDVTYWKLHNAVAGDD